MVEKINPRSGKLAEQPVTVDPSLSLAAADLAEAVAVAEIYRWSRRKAREILRTSSIVEPSQAQSTVSKLE